jgi:Rrf2 family protein
MRAMVDLAATGSDAPVSLKDISKRQSVSVDYLEQLLRRLRKAGLVRSVRGPRGGFLLAREPGQISLWEILVALERDITPVYCVDEEVLMRPARRNCARAEACPTHALWAGLARQMRAFLEANTLQDLVGSTLRVHGQSADGKPVMFHI